MPELRSPPWKILSWKSLAAFVFFMRCGRGAVNIVNSVLCSIAPSIATFCRLRMGQLRCTGLVRESDFAGGVDAGAFQCQPPGRSTSLRYAPLSRTLCNRVSSSSNPRTCAFFRSIHGARALILRKHRLPAGHEGVHERSVSYVPMHT
jgi:hypothetical protein